METDLWDQCNRFHTILIYKVLYKHYRNTHSILNVEVHNMHLVEKKSWYSAVCNDIKSMCDSGQLLDFNYGNFTKTHLIVYFYVFPAVSGAVSPQPTICFSSFISAAQAIWNNSVHPLQNKTNLVCALSSFCIVNFVCCTLWTHEMLKSLN